jgi:hypothetical protein
MLNYRKTISCTINGSSTVYVCFPNKKFLREPVEKNFLKGKTSHMEKGTLVSLHESTFIF